ncbi:MAG: metallophosphatase [Sphingobacteriia bacterium]|nr:metallophosphatase [Sphingobacteriia bacterium]
MLIINRRIFLKQSTRLASGFWAMNKATAFGPVTEEIKLTILHTNDVHGHLDPFPNDNSKMAGLGGVAARAAAIESIRSKTDNVLLFDAGDIFQGTPYFNFFKGEPDIKAMNAMGYNACTLGNHDFDAGMENLAFQLQQANFPAIVSNYDFTETPMDGKTIPYKIFHKQNMKIGVLGVGIELKGLVPKELYGKTKYLEPVAQANKTAALLKQQGCELVICLSHLGDWYYDNKISDAILAKESFGIDLVIGGHTHKLFEEPKMYKNKKGGDVIVHQAGWGGTHLGVLDYTILLKNKKKLVETHTVVIAKKTSE